MISSIQHAENKGLLCPMCKSTDHDYASQSYDAPYFSQKVQCLECSASWLNVYRLAGYEELVPGPKAMEGDNDRIAEGKC